MSFAASRSASGSAYGVDRGVQFLCALAGRAAQLLQAVHDGRVLRLFGLVQQLFGGFVDRRTRGHGRSDCPLKPGAFIVEPLRFGVIAGHYGSGSPLRRGGQFDVQGVQPLVERGGMVGHGVISFVQKICSGLWRDAITDDRVDGAAALVTVD
jgi:hypothetical protein